MNKRSRFTLIELLVVIAIISILASLLLPALERAKEQARDVACKNNQKQIATALHLYADDHRGYMRPGKWAGAPSGIPSNWTNHLAHKDHGYLGGEVDSNSSGVFPGVYACPSGVDSPALVGTRFTSLYTLRSKVAYIPLERVLSMQNIYKQPGYRAAYLEKADTGVQRSNGTNYNSEAHLGLRSHEEKVDQLDDGFIAFRHSGQTRQNVVFLDGHVSGVFFDTLYHQITIKNTYRDREWWDHLEDE